MSTQLVTKERRGVVTMKGEPITLLGHEVLVGDRAPDFEVVANDLSIVRFSSFSGKICIISSVPSLDTSVCSLQTRRFNAHALRPAHVESRFRYTTAARRQPVPRVRRHGLKGVDNRSCIPGPLPSIADG